MDCEPPVAPCLLVLYVCCWLDEIPVCRGVVKVLLVMSGLEEVCLHYSQHPQPLVIGLQLQTHPVCSKHAALHNSKHGPCLSRCCQTRS